MISRVIILLLIFFTFSTHKPVENGCIKLDIILVGDISASVQGYETFVADAFDAFVNKFDLADDGIKIGVVTFETHVKVLSHLTTDKDTLKYAVNRIRREGTGTSTNLIDALRTCSKEILSNGRYGVRKIVIVVSDGDADNKDETLAVANDLKVLVGTNICTVLITSGTPRPDFLKAISSESCYVETNYQNLITEINKLDICL